MTNSVTVSKIAPGNPSKSAPPGTEIALDPTMFMIPYAVTLFLTLLLSFSSYAEDSRSHAATAENSITQVDIETPYTTQNGEKIAINGVVIPVTSPEEMALALELVKDSYQDAIEKNPDLAATVNLETQNGDLPERVRIVGDAFSNSKTILLQTYELPASLRDDIRQKFQSWFHRNYRISLALTRALVNGVVTAWSLSVSTHIPPQAAHMLNFVIAGAGVGAASGSVQYLNSNLRNLLVRPSFIMNYAKKVDEKFNLRIGERKIRLQTAAAQIEQFGKWGALEAAFVFGAKLLGRGLGLWAFPLGIHSAAEVLLTSAGSTAAQGPWDIALALDTKAKLFASDSSEHWKIQFHSDIKAAIISGFSVGLTVLTMSTSAPIGLTGMGAMSLAGFIYRYRVGKRLPHYIPLCRNLIAPPPSLGH